MASKILDVFRNFEPLNLERFASEVSMADYPLTAEAIKNEFKRAGIHFVVALPDRVTSHYLLKGLLADPEYQSRAGVQGGRRRIDLQRALRRRPQVGVDDAVHRLSRLDQRHPRRRGGGPFPRLHGRRSARQRAGRGADASRKNTASRSSSRFSTSWASSII